MNQPLIYGILCEDKAHRNFIEYYLAQQSPNLFRESEQFGWRIKASNAREVDDSVSDAARLGFTKFDLNVLFIGRDTDSTDEKTITELMKTLSSRC